MNQVTFKTLDTATVHEKLIGVGERIAVVSEVIDKWNDSVHCAADSERCRKRIGGGLFRSTAQRKQRRAKKEIPTKGSSIQ